MPGDKPKSKYKRKLEKEKDSVEYNFGIFKIQEAQVCQEEGKSKKSNEAEAQPRPQDQNGTSSENRTAGFVSVSKKKNWKPTKTHQQHSDQMMVTALICLKLADLEPEIQIRLFQIQCLNNLTLILERTWR